MKRTTRGLIFFVVTCLGLCSLEASGPPAAKRPKEFFGIASGYTLGYVEFWDAVKSEGKWSSWWENRFQPDIGRMKELDVGWVMWWMRWYEIEPRKGEFQHLAKVRRVVDELANHQIEVVMDFHGAPCWAAEQPPDCTEEVNPPTLNRLADYQESLRHLVSEFKGKVRNWKILEEENVMFYGNLPVAERARQYARVLKAAYEAVKSVDSSIQVILGGIHVDMFHTPQAKYLKFTKLLVKELEALSNRPLCDVLAMHQHRFPYGPYQVNPYTKRTMAQEIDDLLAVFDQSRLYRGKKLWITNLSWPGVGDRDRVNEGIVSEETQARFLVQAHEVMNHAKRAHRIERWGWVDLRDPDFLTEPPEFEWYYGLLRYDRKAGTWVEKPAYRALKNLPRLAVPSAQNSPFRVRSDN